MPGCGMHRRSIILQAGEPCGDKSAAGGTEGKTALPGYALQVYGARGAALDYLAVLVEYDFIRFRLGPYKKSIFSCKKRHVLI